MYSNDFSKGEDGRGRWGDIKSIRDGYEWFMQFPPTSLSLSPFLTRNPFRHIDWIISILNKYMPPYVLRPSFSPHFIRPSSYTVHAAPWLTRSTLVPYHPTPPLDSRELQIHKLKRKKKGSKQEESKGVTERD